MGDAASTERPWARERGATLLDGKYRLEQPIANGGMGSVWRAVHVTLERLVAVKFVQADGDRAVERFLREAKIAAAIRNPYVVDMLDFGTSPTGDPFIVMELLEGEALDERIEREPVGVVEAVRIMAQLLVGLDAVHRSGIVHRDLKPANVFISNDGGGDDFARLIDFGISHSIDPSSSLRRGQHGTDDRLVVGTPEYIAPEQAEGRLDIDARADVYAAGVMMYEMLGGVLPFEAEHPGALLYKVMNGAHTPLVELRPDIPELAEVVELALSRDRELRPASARELRRLLLSATGQSADLSGTFAAIRRSTPPGMTEEARARPTVDSMRTGPIVRPRPWGKISAGVALVIALVAAGAFAMSRTEEPTPIAALPPAPPMTVPAAPTAPVQSAVAATPPTIDADETTEPVAAPSGTTRTRTRRRVETPLAAPTAPTAPAAPAAPTTLHRELDF
jgi:serine/threonine protein kinase